MDRNVATLLLANSSDVLILIPQQSVVPQQLLSHRQMIGRATLSLILVCDSRIMGVRLAMQMACWEFLYSDTTKATPLNASHLMESTTGFNFPNIQAMGAKY